MSRLSLICLFALSVVLFACKTKVLSLKNKSGYREYNILRQERSTELKQIVSYRTQALDGNFSYILTLTILDSTQLVNKNRLHFPADTNIVKPKFYISSVWNTESQPYVIRGDFTLVNFTDSSVAIEEDIDACDLKGKQHFIYRGKRTFTKPGK